MRLRLVWMIAAVLFAVLALVAGCSDIEPRTGTRATFEFADGKQVSRDKIATICNYLVMRSDSTLSAPRARMDSAHDGTLVLLLPGKKASRASVEKLLQAASLEFYLLPKVATQAHPDRPWRVILPDSERGSYVFTGPDAQRLDSVKDARDVYREIAGYPQTRPVITGADIEHNAASQQASRGWSVLMTFTEAGAKKFKALTREHRGEHLAVFYNGYLMSAAVIDKPIEGGQVFLTGFRDLDEANAAASQINAGTLPVKLRLVSVERY